MIQKQGNWVPYELKPRTPLNADFSHVKCCLPGINERVFCIVQSLVMKNGSTTITQRRGNHEDHLPCFNMNSQAKYSWKKTHCCIFDGSAWCRVLWVAQTERDHYWGSLPNTIDEIEPSTQGKTRPLLLQAWQNYSPACSTHVAAPVKTYLETLKWEVLPHPPYSPDIAPSDYYLFRSMTHGLSEQHFTSHEDTKNCIDDWSLKRWSGIHMLPERWEKIVASDGHYFENIMYRSFTINA